MTTTYNDMCTNGTGAQFRSYFVVLTVYGYATHAIFDDYERRRFMYMDYIIYNGECVLTWLLGEMSHSPIL